MLDNRKIEIRIEADAFRKKCNISGYKIIDLFQECKNMGYKLLRYPIDEEENLGFALKKEDDIVIFTNTSSRLSREIFTLAHEIGHVILHFHNSSSFMDTAQTISNMTTDELEEEANFFAACLLMPNEELDKFLILSVKEFEKNGLTAMDIARLMSEFNVSFDMALNRLENLGKIDIRTRTLLNNQKCEMRVGNLLRAVDGNAKLNEASKTIDLPYEFIEYAIYNYNHNAIPKETVERVLACYNLTWDDVSESLNTPSTDVDSMLGEEEN